MEIGGKDLILCPLCPSLCTNRIQTLPVHGAENADPIILEKPMLALARTRRGGIGIVCEFPRTQNLVATSVCKATPAMRSCFRVKMVIPAQSSRYDVTWVCDRITRTPTTAPGFRILFHSKPCHVLLSMSPASRHWYDPGIQKSVAAGGSEHPR